MHHWALGNRLKNALKLRLQCPHESTAQKKWHRLNASYSMEYGSGHRTEKRGCWGIDRKSSRTGHRSTCFWDKRKVGTDIRAREIKKIQNLKHSKKGEIRKYGAKVTKESGNRRPNGVMILKHIINPRRGSLALSRLTLLSFWNFAVQEAALSVVMMLTTRKNQLYKDLQADSADQNKATSRLG